MALSPTLSLSVKTFSGHCAILKSSYLSEIEGYDFQRAHPEILYSSAPAN